MMPNAHLSVPRRRLAPLQAALLLTAVALGGCGGGGGSSSSTTPDFSVVSGGAACGSSGCGGDSADGSGVGSGADGGDGAGGGLGEMRNAKVTVTKPDGTLLGAAPLQNNLVSLYPGAYTGPIMLAFGDDGSGNGQYFDEALQTWVKFGATTVHVMVPSLTHHVSANVLTETAYQYLKQSRNFTEVSVIDAALITQVNNAVRDAFNARVPAAFQINDITNYAVAPSDTTVANSLPNTHAGRYGTLLAALTLTAQAFDSTLTAPALTFMNELIADMVDDDTINASVTTPTAYDVQLPQSLASAMVNARANYGAANQPSLPTAVPNLCFNPSLFVTGTNWYLTYLVTAGTTPAGDVTFALTVNPPTTFQGNAGAIDVVLNTYAGLTSGTTPTSTVHSYYAPDLSNGLVKYGSTSTFPGSSSLSVFNPPYTDVQYLQRPGDQENLSSSETVTSFDAQGNVIGVPAVVAFALSTTFVGYETVTVSTGPQTFRDACHYSSVNGDGSHTETWFTASGQGVPVKTVDIDANGVTTQSSEYRSGNVNGIVVH